MKIAAVGVNLASAHALHEEQTREESLRFWMGNKRPAFAGEEELSAVPGCGFPPRPGSVNRRCPNPCWAEMVLNADGLLRRKTPS